MPSDHRYRFLIHDRDSIFSQPLDQNMCHLGLRVLKTPPRAPQAHAICERVLGTLRQECLDLMMPLTETHLCYIVREWVRYYNAGRPHMSLGPGIPQPLASLPVPVPRCRHRLPEHLQVVACPILGGLHHDDRLEEKAA
jgi:putative transposase